MNIRSVFRNTAKKMANFNLMAYFIFTRQFEGMFLPPDFRLTNFHMILKILYGNTKLKQSSNIITASLRGNLMLAVTSARNTDNNWSCAILISIPCIYNDQPHI